MLYLLLVLGLFFYYLGGLGGRSNLLQGDGERNVGGLADGSDELRRRRANKVRGALSGIMLV